MEYAHTQRSPLCQILSFAALVALLFAWWYRGDPIAVIISLGIAITLGAAAAMFGYLTVRDEGDCLAVRYGPLPVFRTRIPYSAITVVEQSRSSIIDGWGIHYIPGRGTTYNLWGFDCAKLQVEDRVIRVGSDDVENLVDFLRRKIAQQR